MADGTSKPISDVAVGDEVVATDPETGESGARPVAQLIRHGGEHTMVDVGLDDGSVVSATDGHPFWDVSTGTFTDAIDLEVGELVLTLDGESLQVTSVRVYGEDLVAYNLEIEGIHTYYAGVTPVLVHNSCGSLDDLSAAGARPVGPQGMTAAGQELEKHPGGLFPSGPLGSVSNKNALGQQVLDDILTAPGTRTAPVSGGRFPGGITYIDPTGRGAVFDAMGVFRYFGEFL